MQVIAFTEKTRAKALAEHYGWPLEGAEGYLEGEIFRRRPGSTLPPGLLVGRDDYAMGFRAGYYGRVPCAATLTGRGTEEASPG